MRNRPGAQRPWIHGLVAAVLAVVFAATGAVDAYGLHRCPHHDALPGAAQDAGAAHAGAAHAAAHGAAAADAAAGGHGQDDHGEHGPCSCIGCGATSAAMPGVAARAPRLAPVTFDAPAHRPSAGRALARGDYILPFANAPPFAR